MEYFPWNPKTYQFQKRQKLASDKTEKSSRLPGFQPIITVIGGNCYDRCVFGSGLCFDAEGYRLGYGKGYYDRFLSAFRGVTVGICYTACTQWRLPHGRYDRQIQLLITEKYIRRTYTRGAENGGSHER